MSSLFPDDAKPGGRSGGGRPPFRKFPPRPKVVESALPEPEAGWVLAHCDGGARGNPGPSGFGAVLVDGSGASLAELSEFLGFRTNNYAEYSGLLAVLAWALEHQAPRLRVVSDSELMVKQIQGRYKVNSPDLRPLYDEARKRIGQLERFEIHHALRHKNKDADRLANEAMDRGMGKASAPAAPAKATPYPAATQAPATPVRLDPSPSRGEASVAPRPTPAAANSTMLRGFVRDGVVHVLGGKTLPEGAFVKILPE